ncbi:HAMP domain-containing protein [Clostridium bovifaecis]|uniref:histidine kinase n=1 Tax=Clostridium bovifaecis TaxID=2184719 RepID=A0A6I6F266_9CLOT|nr:HAMP domain-containing protein [Clostridium bovifaecis]
MKIGIKNKIVIMNMAVLVPVIVFICAITVSNLYNNVIKSSVSMLSQESYQGQINTINYLESDKKMNPRTLLKNIGPFSATNLSERYNFRVQIYDEDGIIGDSEEYPSISEERDVKSALSGTKAYIVKKINNKEYILFSSPIYIENQTIGCVRYVYHIDKEVDLIINTLSTMVILGVFALFFCVFLSNIFSEKIVSPIMQLKEASEKVANGDFTDIEEINSRDEITDLARSFNITGTNS